MKSTYPPHDRLVYCGEIQAEITTYVIVDGEHVILFYPRKPAVSTTLSKLGRFHWKYDEIVDRAGPSVTSLREAVIDASYWCDKMKKAVDRADQQLQVPVHEQQDGWQPVDIPGIKSDD